MNDTLERILNVYADEKLVCDGCRKILSGKSTMTLLPDLWQIDIVNVSSSDLAAIKLASNISVSSGENGDTLFSDSPIDIITRIDSGKHYTSLFFMPGEQFWRSTVSLTILSGSTAKSAVDAVLRQSSALVSHIPQLNRRSQRGQAFFGRAADAVSDIAASFGLKAWTVGNDLYAVEKGFGEKAFDLLEQDIVGTPARMNGSIIIDMDVRSAPVGRMISYSGKLYRITAMQVSADTDSGDWYTTLTLTDESNLTQAEWSAR